MKNLNKTNKNTRSIGKSAIRKGKYAPLSYFEYYDDETKTFGRLNSTMCDENGTPIITYKQFKEFMFDMLMQQEHKKRSKDNKRNKSSKN